MSGNELKSFLMPQDLAFPVNQRVETEILYPVSFSQKSVKFVFEKKGILDANSAVRLKLKVANQAGGGASNAFLPINTGVSSLVSRAWLEIGGRRVSTLEKVGDFNTFLNASYTPEYKRGVLKTKEGFMGSVSGSDSQNGIQTGCIALKNENTSVPSHIKLQGDEASPEWSLALSRLIPMLKNFQLPLFAIEQEVSLCIEFNTGELNKRYCLVAGEAEVASTIDQDACILMCDYLYYPDEMDDIAMKIGSAQGYAHIYDEVITIESTENPLGNDPGAGLHLPASFSHQLALAGKTVKGIVVQPFKNANALEGVYVANDDQIEDEYNFKIDSKPYYANDVKNSAFKYKEVSSVLERPLSVNNWEYCFINQVSPVVGNGGGLFVAADSGFADWALEGTRQQVRSATQSWRGVAFSKTSLGVGGRVIGNLPILFNRKRQIMNANVAFTANPDYETPVAMRFYAITSRVLMMKDGQTTIVQ
jgi:hypothetical protein